jgi:hypothetical protein
MGKELKKPLVFVSGERKADWCKTAQGEMLFPCLELIDEYRRASGGQGFYLIQLSDLLAWFEAAPETIKDVKEPRAGTTRMGLCQQPG